MDKIEIKFTNQAQLKSFLEEAQEWFNSDNPHAPNPYKALFFNLDHRAFRIMFDTNYMMLKIMGPGAKLVNGQLSYNKETRLLDIKFEGNTIHADQAYIPEQANPLKVTEAVIECLHRLYYTTILSSFFTIKP